jgi:leucyl aminopeptidase
MVEIRTAASSASAREVVMPDEPVAVRTAAGRLARDLPAGPSELDAAGLAGPRLSAFVEGLALGCYRFTKATRPTNELPTTIELCGATDAAAVATGRRDAASVAWARDLANARAGQKTPAWLGKQAARTLQPLGIDVKVRNLDWLERRGFGGVLAVGGGSAAPPRLIEARWRPPDVSAGEHVVLVGKGITFDTGGLNRKAGAGMNSMYTDMAGGAAVLGALRLIAERGLPIRVTALVPAAENSLSGAAYRPSDVVRHVGGRTSEINNTDAEGRLVLADVLWYVAKKFKPKFMVDLATLTGAIMVALGTEHAGLFSNNDELADRLIKAGVETGEKVWRMPLGPEYDKLIDSQFADMKNTGGRHGGSITAAQFLQRFVDDTPWAHLDIAGTAMGAPKTEINQSWGSGYGVRLLDRLVADHYER